jgi:FkbM family methyltransferase
VARKKLRAPVILDIGARGGLTQPWRSMARCGLVKVFGFEPDAKEASLLNQKYSFSEIMPFALGGEEKETEFYITNSPSCSSFLKPNLEILESYPISRHFQLKSVAKVRIRRLETLVKDGLIPSPKYLKIDVQGY